MFVELMRNRWFSRRWVVQELALAKKASVHYGKEVLWWSDFKDAVALFATKHDEIKALLSRSSGGQYLPKPLEADPVGDMRALGANTLVEATSNLFRRSDDGRILERLMSLETLVSTLLAFEATDPHDIIYALLSIANDTPFSELNTQTAQFPILTNFSDNTSPTPSTLITPDYDQPIADLFIEFVKDCIGKSNSLDIICRHWAPEPSSPPDSKDPVPLKLPSWISSVKNSAFGGGEAALQGRSNSDALVGVPTRRHQRNYHASLDLSPFTQIAKSSIGGPHKFNGTLCAQGLILDSVDKLSPRVASGMVLQESLAMGGWYNDSATERVPDQLWVRLISRNFMMSARPTLKCK